MHENLINAGIIVFIIYAVISMIHMMQVWRVSSEFRAFLKNTEGNLNAALFEMKDTLQDIKKIASDVGTVTGEIRQMTDSFAVLEKSMRSLFQYVRHELAATAESNIAGLKAGVTTGISTFVKTLKERRGDHHEGRTE
jgi:uncharacterized protein YoxC